MQRSVTPPIKRSVMRGISQLEEVMQITFAPQPASTRVTVCPPTTLAIELVAGVLIDTGQRRVRHLLFNTNGN